MCDQSAAVQHTGMVRKGFKRMLAKIADPAIERSTYVLATNLALILMFRLWQPMPEVVWSIQSTAGQTVLYGIFAAGWLIVLLSTFLINHFDLFGLRQPWLAFKRVEDVPGRFVTRGLYKLVRHPLYLGFIIAFWATPVMTAAHLVFAIVTTAYILLAIQFEERDLVSFYGDQYRDYRRRVSMLIPLPPKK